MVVPRTVKSKNIDDRQVQESLRHLLRLVANFHTRNENSDPEGWHSEEEVLLTCCSALQKHSDAIDDKVERDQMRYLAIMLGEIYKNFETNTGKSERELFKEIAIRFLTAGIDLDSDELATLTVSRRELRQAKGTQTLANERAARLAGLSTRRIQMLKAGPDGLGFWSAFGQEKPNREMCLEAALWALGFDLAERERILAAAKADGSAIGSTTES